jgi:hypothetical protein
VNDEESSETIFRKGYQRIIMQTCESHLRAHSSNIRVNLDGMENEDVWLRYLRSNEFEDDRVAATRELNPA